MRRQAERLICIQQSGTTYLSDSDPYSAIGSDKVTWMVPDHRDWA
jgi:hypothetical protein